MTESNKKNPLLCNENPWSNNQNEIWLGSVIALKRNLEKFKFPGKLSADKRKQLIPLFTKDILDNNLLKNPQLIKAENLSPLDKEFLLEHFLTQESFLQAHLGEGFILDESSEFLGVINIGDHLTLYWIDCKEEIEATWEKLVKIETNINKTINFAFSPRFGFLTSDPTLCGTGLIANIYLHLPGLIYSGQLDEMVKKNKDESIEHTSLQGNSSDMIGDIVVFKNAFTLGITEDNILSSLRTLAMRLLVEEKRVRSQMKHDHSPEMKDKVSRAYAILLHSYQIEAIEALNAISLLKLGLNLEWVSGTTQAALNALMFNCRRAHLFCHYGTKISQEEVQHKRAEFIHHILKGVTLRIEDEPS